MTSDRASRFKQTAADCIRKADNATSGELRRSWLIVARDWLAMAEREEAKIKSLKAVDAISIVSELPNDALKV